MAITPFEQPVSTDKEKFDRWLRQYVEKVHRDLLSIGVSAGGVSSLGDLTDVGAVSYDAGKVLVASGAADFDAGFLAHGYLLNIGTKTHAEIDSHIVAVAPHTGHALIVHGHADMALNTIHRSSSGIDHSNIKKGKFDAIVAPTPNNDIGEGYTVGSPWWDIIGNKAYVCLDATVMSAIWFDITIISTLQLSDLTDVHTSMPTNRFFLIGDGVDFESRAAMAADISDFDAEVANNADVTANTTDSHAEAHAVVSHDDTTATGAELDTLTDDSMADTLHRHSELSASDGAPDQALQVDAAGQVGIGGVPLDKLNVHGSTLTGSIRFYMSPLTASSDAHNVTDIGYIRVNTNGGDVRLGGLAGGVANQMIVMGKETGANSFIVEHNEATGTQKFLTHNQLDQTYSFYGGPTFIFNGSHWIQVGGFV